MSRYLQAFERLKKSDVGTDFVIYGDRCLVEEIKAEEIQTKTGIVLAKSVDGYGRNADGLEVNRALFVRILSVGSGFVSEEGQNVEVEIEPGDVVLVSPNSVLWFSTFMNNISTLDVRIGLCRERDVHLRFKGHEAYEKVREFLKTNLEKND